RGDFDLRVAVVRGRSTSHHGPLPRTGLSGAVVAVLLVALLWFESLGTGRNAPPREPAQRGTELAVSCLLLGLCTLFGSSGPPPQPRTRTDHDDRHGKRQQPTHECEQPLAHGQQGVGPALQPTQETLWFVGVDVVSGAVHGLQG